MYYNIMWFNDAVELDKELAMKKVHIIMYRSGAQQISGDPGTGSVPVYPADGSYHETL